MAYVLGLKQYRDEKIIKIFNFINFNEEYMVMMAEAWLLATIAITFPNETYQFLNETSDLILKRKTISKICDSFRFNDEIKSKFKNLRGNIQWKV